MASIVRLYVMDADAVDVVLSIIGALSVIQFMIVAWTSVSSSFHGAGPVRFCAGYVRVPKQYHEASVTQILRSTTAATFMLGNYIWCAKKDTEDSKNNALPAPARPGGLLVLPFRARNPEESGVIALATRYFFVECCFAFAIAIARGILEPCAAMIWVISFLGLVSTLLLIRVRPFNIPFYNTTAVWTNLCVTAAALSIAAFSSGWATTKAQLAGEVLCLMAALGGILPIVLWLIKSVLFWMVEAEMYPVGLLEEHEAAELAEAGGTAGSATAGLEEDLELEAFLSSSKQPVNWPLRRAGELKLAPLPRFGFTDDDLFVRRSKDKAKPSIFSPEGQAHRERLKAARPAQLPQFDERIPLDIPAFAPPTHSIYTNRVLAAALSQLPSRPAAQPFPRPTQAHSALPPLPPGVEI